MPKEIKATDENELFIHELCKLRTLYRCEKKGKYNTPFFAVLLVLQKGKGKNDNRGSCERRAFRYDR